MCVCLAGPTMASNIARHRSCALRMRLRRGLPPALMLLFFSAGSSSCRSRSPSAHLPVRRFPLVPRVLYSFSFSGPLVSPFHSILISAPLGSRLLHSLRILLASTYSYCTSTVPLTPVLALRLPRSSIHTHTHTHTRTHTYFLTHSHVLRHLNNYTHHSLALVSLADAVLRRALRFPIRQSFTRRALAFNLPN